MPKIVDIESVRNEIANAATRVFIKKGYHKTTMNDISAKMKFGRTSIYKYFDNKNEIFIHILSRVLDHLAKTFEPVMQDSGPDPLEKIKTLTDLVLGNYYRHKELVIMVLDFLMKMRIEHSRVLPELNERTFNLRTMFRELLEDGIRRGQVTNVDPEGVAHLLFSLVRALIVQTSLTEEISRGQATRAFNDLIDGLRR